MTTPGLPAWIRDAAAEYDPFTRDLLIGFATTAYITGYEDATAAGTGVDAALAPLGRGRHRMYVRDDDPSPGEKCQPLPAGVDGYHVGGR